MRVVYEKVRGRSDEFLIEMDNKKQLIGLRNSKDSYGMNWIKGDHCIWGTIKCGLDLNVKVIREFTDKGTFTETYIFKNNTDFDIYTTGTEIGICAPFPDYYTDAATGMTQCCNTHIWCGGASSYIMALRMGGEAPHLGLILREGALKGYSVERMASVKGREEELSNHRGDFILHPESLHLRPGEEYRLTWEIFWFQDQEEFQRILSNTKGFLHIKSPAFVLTEKEKITFEILTPDHTSELQVMRAGKKIPYTEKDGRIEVCELPASVGEYHYEISLGNRKSRTSFYVLPELERLAEKRVHFIADRQQCHDEKSYLNGAYLVYDNEEKRQYYGHRNDINGGRERVGMGVLMAHYLQRHPDKKLRESLDQYIAYVLRELYDEETGEVFNDAPRCRDYIRLYNAPWMGRLFLEMYLLTKDAAYLDRYLKCMTMFYQSGGDHFYAIALPMYESVEVFREADRIKDAETLLDFYKKHGDFIITCGSNYPAHEVAYEQSIVAPAADYMCELYLLTGEEKYRQEAEAQMERLELFQGFQPDYHMNEVAIRHWDGYWFGKRRCLGDTFPHYWSALSGCAYTQMNKMTDSDKYREKARKTLRAVLSLFREDGSASCAMVYPMSVNGTTASFYDPWANDQDWGLYFALKYL